ncbi:hypothetical protein M885DRAFT_580997 [Pelagophyceae sp. CCMP2097]|nr:hypothetical protein M885DRAFT_580997 [Pelagophyceae sp. CCMP2097]
MRTLAGEERCLGCTCQENVLGQGESFFEVFSDNIRLFVDEPDAGASKVFEYCLSDGDYAILASDRRGSKWFGGAMIVSVKTFLGVELIKQSAVWGTNGSQTNPIHFTVPAFAQESLAVRFFGNEALGGGGAAIFWVDRAPAGLETAATHSSNNKASYGDFAATPATRLVVNTTDLTAVPNAAMPSIAAVLLDDYGRTVSSDSSTPVGAVFQDGVQASGLVSICSFGRADFDAITITGKPGDEHALTFYSPTNGLAAGPLKYTKYYIQGACIPCPRGADCDRYPPLDALSQSVGYQLFTVATLPVKVGFYRFYATSAVFYPCADAEYCDTTNCACAGASYDVAFRDPRKTHGQRLCRGSRRLRRLR